ncbi:hypothetical protein ACFC0C_12770 [Streptomyces sp. NPDC056178]|uniref:hypothetical protein n=1 Tax=Streptomyces sp. NPDC056178 TaxID=3345735 RepID=UPI0035DD77BB
MGRQQAEPGGEGGFAADQPCYVFEVPFPGPSLKKIQRAQPAVAPQHQEDGEAGVKAVQGEYEDVPAFYDIHVETAEQDRFISSNCQDLGIDGYVRCPARKGCCWR